jgi:hypothetical protein
MLSDAPKPVPFWIDTLCVPVATSAKFDEYEKLQRISHQAEKILVLDKNLMQRQPATKLEALSMIRESDWLKRLWTVEEGALARDLFFRFADDNLQLKDLVDSNKNAKPASRTGNGVAAELGTPHTWKDDQSLFSTMISFGDDMKFAERAIRASTSSTLANTFLGRYDLQKMRRVLRTVALAQSHMQYLQSEADVADSDIVLPLLLRLYSSSSTEKIPSALGRLSKVDLLEFQ